MRTHRRWRGGSRDSRELLLESCDYPLDSREFLRHSRETLRESLKIRLQALDIRPALIHHILDLPKIRREGLKSLQYAREILDLGGEVFQIGQYLAYPQIRFVGLSPQFLDLGFPEIIRLVYDVDAIG